jgi:outer membrane protein assembly factor BamB
VGAKDGVVVVATNRCVDRYCYKYRYLVNRLLPGNTLVRGLSLEDGSALWEYKTYSPVWNMVPQWGKDGTVMFNDGEGSAYCLDLQTGKEIWKAEGNIGTYTQAAGVYAAELDMFISLGTAYYEGDDCNPYTKRGIKHTCSAKQYNESTGRTMGNIWAYNATSGRQIWKIDTREVPASASVPLVTTNIWGHLRIMVTLGYNCRFNSPSVIKAISPEHGRATWTREGPTLWTSMCAGDKEGGDVRRAMGGRAACVPNSWTIPAVDKKGDIYVGTQVGMLQRWGSPTGRTRDVQLLSTLATSAAFTDNGIAFGDGFMAVSTCNSLIVIQT